MGINLLTVFINFASIILSSLCLSVLPTKRQRNVKQSSRVKSDNSESSEFRAKDHESRSQAGTPGGTRTAQGSVVACCRLPTVGSHRCHLAPTLSFWWQVQVLFRQGTTCLWSLFVARSRSTFAGAQWHGSKQDLGTEDGEEIGTVECLRYVPMNIFISVAC